MDTNLASDLRDALAHLYDHVYLETHPLAEKIAAHRAGIARTRAQETRRILLDAIELLNPGGNVPLRAPERRAYEVLFGLYVEGHESHEVADNLGIGERQLRRDRAAATEALATIIHDRYLVTATETAKETAKEKSTKRLATESAPTGASAGASTRVSMDAESLHEESRRLAHHYETVDLPDFFANLLPILTALARERNVEIAATIPPTLPHLPLSYPLLRQIVLSLASRSIRRLPLRRMAFLAQVTSQMAAIGLELTYAPGQAPTLDDARRQIADPQTAALHITDRNATDPNATDRNAVETMVTALDGRLHWEAHSDKHSDKQRDERHCLWVLLPRHRKMSVLVVEDKSELFELFLRYLAGHPYQLRHASTVDDGLEMVQTDRPDMVLLDLMMPERDGWEFLQALRMNPDLAHIPVIVCSVLHEPDLAFSLGAQHYLKKPVTADELVQALEEVRRQVWVAGTHPTAPAPN